MNTQSLSSFSDKAIVQGHPMGCAVACTAFVLRLSYDDALALFDDQNAASTDGYYCRDVKRALHKKTGKTYRFSKVTDKNRAHIFENDVIVFCQSSAQYVAGHYLVRSGDGWMNPWVNCPRIDPAKAGFVETLPSEACWMIYPV